MKLLQYGLIFYNYIRSNFKVMKKTLPVLVILSLVLGCKKDTTLKSTGLTGKWDLVEVLYATSGYTVSNTVSYAVGQGNFIQFNADSTRIFYTEFKMMSAGPVAYHIIKYNSTFGLQTYDQWFGSNTKAGQPFKMHGDTLTLGPAVPMDDFVPYEVGEVFVRQ